MTDESRLQLVPQAPDEDGIKIYVTPEISDTLKADLDAAGFETSRAMEHALGVDDIIILAVAVGGLPGLAAVLNAFFHKNQHRSIVVKAGDKEVALMGMSKGETKAVVDDCLKQVREQQKSLDESWRQVREETEGDDSGGHATGPSDRPK